ncbi:MAG: hypothetical protein ACOYOQ_00215 [Microthrixaceae bacterium]
MRRPPRPDLPGDAPNIPRFIEHLAERGLWNDPGSGRFIRRGMSTAKARSILLTRNRAAQDRLAELERLVNEAGDEGVYLIVGDGRMRRGGYEPGDYAQVFPHPTPGYGRVRALTSARWYDVQLARFSGPVEERRAPVSFTQYLGAQRGVHGGEDILTDAATLRDTMDAFLDTTRQRDQRADLRDDIRDGLAAYVRNSTLMEVARGRWPSTGGIYGRDEYDSMSRDTLLDLASLALTQPGADRPNIEPPLSASLPGTVPEQLAAQINGGGLSAGSLDPASELSRGAFSYWNEIMEYGTTDDAIAALEVFGRATALPGEDVDPDRAADLIVHVLGRIMPGLLNERVVFAETGLDAEGEWRGPSRAAALSIARRLALPAPPDSAVANARALNQPQLSATESLARLREFGAGLLSASADDLPGSQRRRRALRGVRDVLRVIPDQGGLDDRDIKTLYGAAGGRYPEHTTVNEAREFLAVYAVDGNTERFFDPTVEARLVGLAGIGMNRHNGVIPESQYDVLLRVAQSAPNMGEAEDRLRRVLADSLLSDQNVVDIANDLIFFITGTAFERRGEAVDRVTAQMLRLAWPDAPNDNPTVRVPEGVDPPPEVPNVDPALPPGASGEVGNIRSAIRDAGLFVTTGELTNALTTQDTTTVTVAPNRTVAVNLSDGGSLYFALDTAIGGVVVPRETDDVAAARYLNEVMPRLRDLGFAGINAEANTGGTPTAGYALALAGFDWRTGGTNARKQTMRDLAQAAEAYRESDPALYEAATAMARAGGGDISSAPDQWPSNLPTPLEVATLGYKPGMTENDTWLGKEVMRRSQFAAQFRFNTETQRAVLPPLNDRLLNLDPDGRDEAVPFFVNRDGRDTVEDAIAQLPSTVRDEWWTRRKTAARITDELRDLGSDDQPLNMARAIVDSYMGVTDRRAEYVTEVSRFVDGLPDGIDAPDLLARLSNYGTEDPSSDQPREARAAYSRMVEALNAYLDARGPEAGAGLTSLWDAGGNTTDVVHTAEGVTEVVQGGRRLPDGSEMNRDVMVAAIADRLMWSYGYDAEWLPTVQYADLSEYETQRLLRTAPRQPWFDPRRPYRGEDMEPLTLTEDEVRNIYEFDIGNGWSSRVSGVSVGSHSASVSGSVFDPQGRAVGHYSRSLNLRDRSLYHSSFTMGGARGQGIGSKFITESIRRSEAAGFRKITVSAASGGMNGAYTWARAGFDWGHSGEAKERGRIIENWSRTGMSAELSAQLDDMAERLKQRWGPNGERPANLPTPNDVALLGWEEGANDWSGRRIMLRTGWSGVMFLNPPPPVPLPLRPVQRTRRTGNADWRPTEETIRTLFQIDDLENGFSSEVRRIDEGNGMFVVNGSIRDADGNSVGTFTRKVSKEEPTVTLSFLELEEAVQGQGLGTRFTQGVLSRLQRAGVRDVRVEAAGSDGMNGAYTWARAGFDWEDGTEARMVVYELDNVLNNSGREFPPEVVARAGELIDAINRNADVDDPADFSDDMPTPNDVAMLGWERDADTWFGKQFLSGGYGDIAWNGLIRLEPTVGRVTNPDWQPPTNDELAAMVEAPSIRTDRIDTSPEAVERGRARFIEATKTPLVSRGNRYVGNVYAVNVGYEPPELVSLERRGLDPSLRPVYDESARGWISVIAAHSYQDAGRTPIYADAESRMLADPPVENLAAMANATTVAGVYVGPDNPPIRAMMLNPDVANIAVTGGRWQIRRDGGQSGPMDYGTYPYPEIFISDWQALRSDPDVLRREVAAARAAGVDMRVLTRTNESLDPEEFVARVNADPVDVPWGGPDPLSPTTRNTRLVAQRRRDANLSPEITDMEEARTRVRTDGPVVQVGESAFAVMATRGRVPTAAQREGDNPTLSWRGPLRRMVEHHLFGYEAEGEGTRVPPGRRPIYGGPSGGDGRTIELELDPSVASRTTMTWGSPSGVADATFGRRYASTGSLGRRELGYAPENPTVHGQAVPVVGDVGEDRLLAAVAPNAAGRAGRQRLPYVQVHGGLNVNEVRAVRIYNSRWLGMQLQRLLENPIPGMTLKVPPEAEAQFPELLDQLRAAGFNVMVV